MVRATPISFSRVLFRLRSTQYRNWLLVIDSAENLDQDGLAKYIPSCSHGSILVTSTRRQARCGPRQLEVANIDDLDNQSSLDLLLKLARYSDLDDETEMIAAKEVAKELDEFPLAIEQAARLIREGEFTFSDFLDQYRSIYRHLMAINSSDELWSYDKSRVILTILDMAHRSLDSEELGDTPMEVVKLQKILSERPYLRLSLRRLCQLLLDQTEGGVWPNREFNNTPNHVFLELKQYQLEQ
ncbi:hypothetical protein EDB81DRAFT_882341 [Dactylonectria macrodidyma]|uniref:NB-ARC domain-containing protein n=1 Tax=Dactylonectria macrodidyma TaxID=307937 RepID=A0A9P9J6V4_9HYPO|nr:hypothetical protein EDB81DRAFT_882341 [Dactylonectria macrodidyma]